LISPNQSLLFLIEALYFIGCNEIASSCFKTTHCDDLGKMHKMIEIIEFNIIDECENFQQFDRFHHSKYFALFSFFWICSAGINFFLGS